jgi:hypothetical protein
MSGRDVGGQLDRRESDIVVTEEWLSQGGRFVTGMEGEGAGPSKHGHGGEGRMYTATV